MDVVGTALKRAPLPTLQSTRHRTTITLVPTLTRP